MRIYQSFGEMYSEVQRDVAELGIRVKSDSVQNIRVPGKEYDMMEIIGYSYELQKWRDYEKYFTPEELLWLYAEFAERINFVMAINPGEAWKYRKEIWAPFLDANGRFDYTYNQRMRSQLGVIMEELRRRPNTRQAVMTIYSPLYFGDMYLMGGTKRIPCSISYQFLLRQRYLYIVYNMRSCDVTTHFRFDVMLACMLIEYVAKGLDDVQPGSLVHNVGSLHIFRKDAKGIF